MCPTVDEIFQRLRVDALNYNPNFPISQGTDSYIRFSCIASIVWGAYKHLDWTLDQIFPPSMSQESLEKFATSRGLSAGSLTPAEFLQFVLTFIRNPPSGGKDTDFERWSLEASSQGNAVALAASMVSDESTIASIDKSQLVDVHNNSSDTGVAFEVGSDDIGKHVLVDLGESKRILGAGLGFITVRGAVFKVYSSDEASGPWTLRGSINIESWWDQAEFDAVSARFWKISLDSIEALESWQTPALNTAKCYGLELYETSNLPESAATARCLKNHYGTGTVMMLVTPSTLSMRCCKAISDKCEYECPVAPKEIYVNVPKEKALVLRATITGSVDEDQFRLAVKRYFATLNAGDRFIPAQLVIYAIAAGAEDAVIEIYDNGVWEQALTIIPDPEEKLTLGSLTVQ